MKISVRIEEKLSRTVEVEAENGIYAVSKVAKMYTDGDIVLTADDHVDTTLYIERND